MIFEIVCYSLSGFFMKLSDELMDEKNYLLLAIISGLLTVFFSLSISTINADAACIFLSILIGTALAYKVDTVNHIISAVLFISLLLLIGCPKINYLCLILCIVANIIDEKGNDWSDKSFNDLSKNRVLKIFFKYRYTLKITVFILSAITLINIMLLKSTYLMLFEPLTIIYFYCFDLSYEVVGLIFDRFNNFF